MTRRRRMLLAAAVVLFVATAVFGPYLAASRSLHNSRQIAGLQQTAQNVQRGEQEIRQVLEIVQQATGKPAQRATAAVIAELVRCLNNRIDADTGHGRLDPTCAALAQPPPAADPPATTTTTVPAYIPRSPTTAAAPRPPPPTTVCQRHGKARCR